MSQWRSDLKETMLNLSPADLGLVLIWRLFPQVSCYVTVLPQNLETWNNPFIVFLESVGQKFRQDTVERVVSGPQAWSFHWKDSRAGGDSVLGTGILWKLIHTHVWASGLGWLKDQDFSLEPLYAVSLCGLASSVWLPPGVSCISAMEARGSKCKCSSHEMEAASHLWPSLSVTSMHSISERNTSLPGPRGGELVYHLMRK